MKRTLAIKALAHKLARACYYVLRDAVVFEPTRLLGSLSWAGCDPGVALVPSPPV